MKGFEISGAPVAEGVRPAFIVQISQLPHATFARRDADLLMDIRIPLVDSLTGFDLSVPTLSRKIFKRRISQACISTLLALLTSS